VKYLDTYNLIGKTAIVTGAGRGIGKSTAVTLACLGARVLINSLEPAHASRVVEEITSHGGEAAPCPGDVSSPEEAKKTIKNCLDLYGRIDILVNNAGVGGEGRKLHELSHEEWNRIIRVNLNGTFNFCKQALPYMIEQRSGKIINISSIFGITGNSGSVPYSSAKAGIIGLTKALAKEVAEFSINVNAVAPGLIESDMSKKRGTDNSMVLWPRTGVPEDVAHTVAFLASSASEFITGQVISPNGGGLI